MKCDGVPFEPYWHLLPYDRDAAQALAALRRREVASSIQEIARVADVPGWGVASPLPDDICHELYGTRRPTRRVVAAKRAELFEYLRRGHCVYVTVYRNDEPHELLFAGYSSD